MASLKSFVSSSKRSLKSVPWMLLASLVLLGAALYFLVRAFQRPKQPVWELFEDAAGGEKEATAATAATAIAKKHPMLDKWSAHVQDVLNKKKKEETPKATATAKAA